MRKDTRTTALVAIGTFLALSLVTVLVWAMKKPASPAMPETFERITIEELKPLADRGEVTIIDVRASEAYVASHIPGALHIPLTRLEGEISYLPKGKAIVTYCSCPAEESSGDAAMLLRKFGFDAKALLGGYEAWTKLQLPTAAGVQ